MSQSNTRMTAVVCHGPEDYRVEQVERPTPGLHELVIKIAACGVCAVGLVCPGSNSPMERGCTACPSGSSNALNGRWGRSRSAAS